MGVVLSLLVLACAPAAWPSDGIDLDATGQEFWLLSPGERLVFEDTASVPFADPAFLAITPASKPNWLLTSLVSGGAVVGAALNGLLEGGNQSYHFGDEGWFEADSHFGGADKVSHFVDYYILSKEFAKLFVVFGHKPEHARWLAAGVSAFTGLVNEIGDGTTRFGFSYEDLVMDFGGALSAAVISAASAEDLVGFRRGLATLDDCCGFSNEIYTADLRLAGAARRLGWNIGPLKYLLLSVTYGVKGYPGDPVNPQTQRQVGFEMGLDFKQMLDDLKVGRNTWWGYGLHVVFDNVRFPFTAVGYRYDLNHGRWHGPNAGN